MKRWIAVVALSTKHGCGARIRYDMLYGYTEWR